MSYLDLLKTTANAANDSVKLVYRKARYDYNRRLVPFFGWLIPTLILLGEIAYDTGVLCSFIINQHVSSSLLSDNHVDKAVNRSSDLSFSFPTPNSLDLVELFATVAYEPGSKATLEPDLDELDLDELRMIAKDLGVKGWNFYQKTDSILTAITAKMSG